jgi:hypothetical protein
MSWLDRWRQNVVLEARQKYESVRQVITYCQKIGAGRASSPDSEAQSRIPEFLLISPQKYDDPRFLVLSSRAELPFSFIL